MIVTFYYHLCEANKVFSGFYCNECALKINSFRFIYTCIVCLAIS